MTSIITLLLSILALAGSNGYNISTEYGVVTTSQGDGILVSDYAPSHNYISYKNSIDGKTPEVGSVIKTILIEKAGECVERVDFTVDGKMKATAEKLEITVNENGEELLFEVPDCEFVTPPFLIVDRLEDDNIAVLKYTDCNGEMFIYDTYNIGYKENEILPLYSVEMTNKEVIFTLTDGKMVSIEI